MGQCAGFGFTSFVFTLLWIVSFPSEGAMDKNPDHYTRVVYTQHRSVRSSDASDAWLTRNLAHWDREGFGQWMLHTGMGPIGRGGLRRIDPCVGEDLVEVGFVLARESWGHGYATEATLVFVELARSHFGFDQIGAITLEGNASSVSVLEKCGFTFERSVDHDIGLHRFYRLRL